MWTFFKGIFYLILAVMFLISLSVIISTMATIWFGIKAVIENFDYLRDSGILKLVLAILIFFLIMLIAGRFAESHSANVKRISEGVLGLGGIGCFGLVIVMVIGFATPVVKDMFQNPEDWGGGSCYECGSDPNNTDNPGVHNVNGYYRTDGTYVRPYIRSNPDGDPTNNLNN